VRGNIDHVIRLLLIAAEPSLVQHSNNQRANTIPHKQFGFYGFDLMIMDDLEVQLVR
jgi:hypothetical protein